MGAERRKKKIRRQVEHMKSLYGDRREENKAIKTEKHGGGEDEERSSIIVFV